MHKIFYEFHMKHKNLIDAISIISLLIEDNQVKT